MPSAADKLRQKAARISAAPSAPSPAADAAPADVDPVVPPPTRAATTETVRSTIDLAAELHDRFDTWARGEARRHRLGRSIRPDVLRILVRRLLSDTDEGQQLRNSVVTELRRERAR